MKEIKVCVVGLGAIGSWLAYRLAALPQVQLSCLVKPSHLSAIEHDGLRLSHASSHEGEQPLPPLKPHRISDQPQELGPQDWVILCIKSTALADMAQSLKPLLHQDTSILSVMNGVPWWFFNYDQAPFKGRVLKSIDPLGQIQEHLPLERWLGTVVHASCTAPRAGHCHHHFGQTLITGEPTGKTSVRAQEITQLLSLAGFDSVLSPFIQKDIWYKLLGNMTINPLSALTGATTDLILGDDLVKALVSQVMLEAKEMGAKMSLPITQTPEDRHLVTAKLGAFKTSMLQDFEAKRPLELNALIGAVHEMSRWLEHPTPYMDALFGLSRLHARVHGLYP